MNVDNYWDRGMMGLAVDPNYTIGQAVCLRPVHVQPHPRRRGRGPALADERVQPVERGLPESAPRDDRRVRRVGPAVSPDVDRRGDPVMTGSEKVLVEDWCQQFPSHSQGALMFGPGRRAVRLERRRRQLQQRGPGLRPARRDAAEHADAGQPVRRPARRRQRFDEPAVRRRRLAPQPGRPDDGRSDRTGRHDHPDRPGHRDCLADQRQHRQQRRQHATDRRLRPAQSLPVHDQAGDG